MAFTPRLGDNSWFAIARQTESDKPVETVDAFVQNRFPFTSLGLDVESELQASEAIAGRRSDTRDQQGQLWGSGPIETQLYIEKMDEFWRAILNSKEPSSTSTPATITNIADTEIYTSAPFQKTIEPNQSGKSPFAVPEVPGQVEITLAATANNTLPADADIGTVEVHGQRRVGLETDALIPMKEEGLTFDGGVAKTTKYFARVDKIIFTVPAETTTLTGTTTTTTIAAKSGQSSYVYKNRDAIFPGWTLQLVRGKVPAVAEGAVPVNTTLTISENIRLRMEILARKLRPFTEIGTKGEVSEITNALKNMPYVSDVFYPNWGGYLEVEGNCLIFTNLTLNINQNLDFLPGIKASRFRLPIAAASERRNVTLNANVYYEFDESQEKWSEIFQDNAARRLTAFCYYWNEVGKQFSQKFSLPVSYLTASPRIGIDGRGPITRTLAFKGVPLSDNSPDEIEIEIVKDAPL